MIQHQMNTQPLILCAILVAIGICMGVTLGMIAHVVLKEPAVEEGGMACLLQTDHTESVITRVFTAVNMFL